MLLYNKIGDRMIEGFKITATKIKRIIKLAVHIPDDYYTNNKKYPLLLCLDGGLFFSFLNEDNKIIDLKAILDDMDKDFIAIGLFGPRLDEWNISELNPYYFGDNTSVDVSYSSIYLDYITNELIPLLKQKYRIDDNVNVFGVGLGAISVIPLLAKYDTYKAGIMLSINYNEVNDLIFDDAKRINNKSIYLYQGELNSSLEDLDKFSELEKILLENSSNNFIVDYRNDLGNSTKDIEINIRKGLDLV